jgi:DNA modification methylase
MIRVLQGDCRAVLKTLPEKSVHCIVTSPPYYGLRDYGHEGQLGLEQTPEEYIANMVEAFRCARDVLVDDGTLWLNIGDSYFSTMKGTGGTAKSGLNAKRDDDGSLHQDRKSQPTNQGYKMSAGDTGCKPKDLIGIPWMLAFALRADGWWLRQDIIWHKPNPMPESVTDRCTKAHEYVFLLSKRERYYFDADAIAEPAVYGGEELGIMRGDKVRAEAMGREPSGNELAAKQRRESKKRGEFNGKTNALPGREAFRAIKETRNKRSVWTVTSSPFAEAHFATFPPSLIEPCILAGCPDGGTVLDPFGGAGTTGLVADRHHRSAILIELNPEYAEMARKRIVGDSPLFAEVT